MDVKKLFNIDDILFFILTFSAWITKKSAALSPDLLPPATFFSGSPSKPQINQEISVSPPQRPSSRRDRGFLDSSMNLSHLDGLLKNECLGPNPRVSFPVDLGWDPTVCIPSKFTVGTVLLSWWPPFENHQSGFFPTTMTSANSDSNPYPESSWSTWKREDPSAPAGQSYFPIWFQ